MRIILSPLFILFTITGCGGSSPASTGHVINDGSPGSGPPVKNDSPQTTISKFGGLGITISCPKDCVANNAGALQTLDTHFSDFQRQVKGLIQTVTLQDGTQPMFDAAAGSLIFPSTLVDQNVANFFSALANVERTEALLGIPLSFPADPFITANLTNVLASLTKNRTMLSPYRGKITLIDCQPGVNQFSKGIWTVDRKMLEDQFDTALNAIKSQI